MAGNLHFVFAMEKDQDSEVRNSSKLIGNYANHLWLVCKFLIYFLWVVLQMLKTAYRNTYSQNRK